MGEAAKKVSKTEQATELLAQAQKAGYHLILGLFDDKSENVYHIMALCKNPDAWEPYRAPRCFEEADAVALWWYFDEELTQANTAGEMIYHASNEDLDEDEEPQEENQELFEDADLFSFEEGFESLGPAEKDMVLKRLAEVVSGTVTERWDAPRTDQ